MKLLITGASGYLGGRLAAYLLGSGPYELLLCVTPGTELDPKFSNCDVLESDLTDPRSLPPDLDVDAVIHLAAVNELVSAQDPHRALDVNVGGTLNLLESLSARVQHVIYMSTFHVYGANACGRVDEQTPVAPVHPYAATHAMAELYVGMYARDRGNDASIVRLSNGYGAPLTPTVDRWSLVVNDLCRQAVERGSLTLRSHGLQLRDFIHVEDVSRAIELLLAERPAGVQTLNLGFGESQTILQVARTVRDSWSELAAEAIEIDHPSAPPDFSPTPLIFGGGEFERLGFAPSVLLADGVEETLNFCAKHFQREPSDDD